MRDNTRTALTMSFEVWPPLSPRRRRGRRSGVCTPPFQWITSTTSLVSSSMSTTTSRISARKSRFFVRSSACGSFHKASRSLARSLNSSTVPTVVACMHSLSAAIRDSIFRTSSSAEFHRRSSSCVTKRFSGSEASYCRSARCAR